MAEEQEVEPGKNLTRNDGQVVCGNEARLLSILCWRMPRGGHSINSPCSSTVRRSLTILLILRLLLFPSVAERLMGLRWQPKMSLRMDIGFIVTRYPHPLESNKKKRVGNRPPLVGPENVSGVFPSSAT